MIQKVQLIPYQGTQGMQLVLEILEKLANCHTIFTSFAIVSKELKPLTLKSITVRYLMNNWQAQPLFIWHCKINTFSKYWRPFIFLSLKKKKLQSAKHKNYIPLPKNNWIHIFRSRHRLQQNVGGFFNFSFFKTCQKQKSI